MPNVKIEAREAIVDWLSGGRAHNWKNYVGERTQALWPTLTPEQREAIALDADDLAGAEDWG